MALKERDKGEGEGIRKPTNKARQLHREVNVLIPPGCVGILSVVWAGGRIARQVLKKEILFFFLFYECGMTCPVTCGLLREHCVFFQT